MTWKKLSDLLGYSCYRAFDGTGRLMFEITQEHRSNGLFDVYDCRALPYRHLGRYRTLAQAQAIMDAKTSGFSAFA